MADHQQHGRPSSTSSRGLTRALIVESALGQIDRSGPHSLSMRSLAHELGVEAMSLYRYVEGKEDLLEGVVDRLMGDVTSNLDQRLTEHWQGFLQALGHEVRSLAVEHPKAFPLVATRPPSAPWLRPPLRSIEVVDTFLSTLLGYGFTDAQAVHAYRTFSSFLLGHLLLEAAVRGAVVSPAESELGQDGERSDDGADGSPLDNAPEVRRLRPLLSRDRSDDEFEAALEATLDRLAQDLAQ